MIITPSQRHKSPPALLNQIRQVNEQEHKYPKPKARGRRFFHLKPGLMLDQYIDLKQAGSKYNKSHKLQPFEVKLPIVSGRAKQEYKTARRSVNQENQQKHCEVERKNRLLSPKILKFRAESLGKRPRIFSADSKAKENKKMPGWLFTFGRQQQ